ncbi:2Fe-2S iron-sulfur cluster-binding protein [Roseibium album]|uniref:Na(+)-translocating NADH-quinone reductase subunit F n=1 Tax=Roseibium album TaxID=311410 RepID=A0A0M6ZE60_9HYPH|nr:2Fe-2S iron-sulfur cluster-binding protein [Roseibium album]CTQ61075.1 Na(+)-translocating NADH-quinone reductase subunit F [Roseibium album]CTQ64036.1 Na(+)-translocating NADH-quinone reductase subunit F [Roseibium album]CTQ72486.1 Na(+)-translocating NADH-quinone reductase subunit F [Roseibium album]
MTLLNKLRIASGLVLFVFVLGHLLTLAFGLRSIEAMETAGRFLMGPWTNPVGGPILMLSFLLHGALGIWALFWRNRLFFNWGDSIQALLGIAIVPLLLPHIMGTVVGPAMTGATPSFKWVLAVYWMFVPHLGIQQVIALIVIWIHGCYGLFLWMQVQNWWGRISTVSYPFVVIVPVAALLGFVEAGKILLANSGNAEFMAPVRETATLYGQVGDQLWRIQDQILWAYAAIVAVVFAARAVRVWRKRPMVTLNYVDGPTIVRPAGLSLLETAQSRDTPHAALCGARGRCGSCAVRIVEGAGNLSPVGPIEAETLARRSAAPGDRLACQAMPVGGSVLVEPLFSPDITPIEYQELLRGEVPDPPVPEPASVGEGSQ